MKLKKKKKILDILLEVIIFSNNLYQQNY